MRCLVRSAGGLSETKTAPSSSESFSSAVRFRPYAWKDPPDLRGCRAPAPDSDSFSAALHPPTFELEVQTLVAGGSYVPSPAGSPAASTSHDFPPSSPSASPPRGRPPISPALRTLLHETSDALDSPDAALVRALSLDVLFSLLLQRLEPAFTTGGSGGGDERGSRFEDVSEKTTRLASLLPLVTKLAGTTGLERGVLSSGVNGNEFVEVSSVTALSLSHVSHARGKRH